MASSQNKFVAEEVKLDFADVLLAPQESEVASRSQVSVERSFTFRNSRNTLDGIVPIWASNMDTVVDFTFAKRMAQLNLLAAIPKHHTLEDWQQFSASFTNKEERSQVFKHLAVCTGLEDLAKVKQICDAIGDDLQMVCIDVANGYTTHFCDAIRRLREANPKKTIIAGNVVTPDMVVKLLDAGADVVKVGIGPGSVCQTRLKAGVGYPQFSAVLECAQAAHKLNGYIISDGGCSSPGDVAKAFGGGADFVMLGGMLAGHDECPGKVERIDGKRYKLFYGMASKQAQEKHQGGLAEYRASEGKTVAVPLRGPVSATVQDILGGLRSACTYVGARHLEEFGQKAKFIRVYHQLNQSLSQFDLPDKQPTANLKNGV